MAASLLSAATATGAGGPVRSSKGSKAYQLFGATTAGAGAATVGTAIDVGEFLVNTTPVANGVAVPAAFMNIAITDNIIGTVSVGTITAGAVRFDVLWRPLSPDGNVA